MGAEDTTWCPLDVKKSRKVLRISCEFMKGRLMMKLPGKFLKPRRKINGFFVSFALKDQGDPHPHNRKKP
jgi:hypothetical protein